MTKMGAVLVWLALTGCYIEQDVLVTDGTTETAGLLPSFRYAYYREDPARNRVHIRFTDYWNPCIADAQLQSQLRAVRNPDGTDRTAADRADSYADLVPKRTWSADVYLQVVQWPNQSRGGIEFPITTPTDGNYDLPCLLYDCPYETACDTCLPTQQGAVVAVTRTTDHLPVAYFEDDPIVDEQVQQFATDGSVSVSVWLPSLFARDLTDPSTPIDETAQISGTLDVVLREATQVTDNGTMQVDFTATVCPEMQAAFMTERLSFDAADVTTYGPSATCQVAGPRALGAFGLVGGMAALLLRRRRTKPATPSPITPTEMPPV